MAKDLIKSFFLFISLPRNRDAMRLNRHITPLFGALGKMLKASFSCFVELYSSELFIPSVEWFHFQLWGCLRCNAQMPCLRYEIWHLGKNKIIKQAAS